MELSNLVFNKNGQAVTNSLIIAKYFEREHKSVIRAVKDVLEQLTQSEDERNNKNISIELLEYIDDLGRSQSYYVMNKPASLLVMLGFTGQKAFKFKLMFIEAFDQLEKILRGLTPYTSLPITTQAKIINEDLRAIAKSWGTPESIINVTVANYINRELNLNLKELLCNNIASTQDDLMNPTEIGKLIDKSARAMNILLLDHGLQIKLENGNWSLTEKGKSFGTYLDTAKKHSDGTPIQQIKWYKEKTLKFLSENEINEDEE